MEGIAILIQEFLKPELLKSGGIKNKELWVKIALPESTVHFPVFFLLSHITLWWLSPISLLLIPTFRFLVI